MSSASAAPATTISSLRAAASQHASAIATRQKGFFKANKNVVKTLMLQAIIALVILYPGLLSFDLMSGEGDEADNGACWGAVVVRYLLLLAAFWAMSGVFVQACAKDAAMGAGGGAKAPA